MATVLCAALHEGIIATRRLVLEEAGHVVVPAMSSPEIIAACQGGTFDVAVIGETGHSQTTREWAALIRLRSPGTKILEVYASHLGATVPSVDLRLEAPASPAELSACVAELSKKETIPMNAEQIRELCVAAIKSKKGAEFEEVIQKLAEAINQYAEGRDEKDNKPA